MSTHLVSPDMEVTIAGKQCLLNGSFASLKVIQHAFEKDITDIHDELMGMRTDLFVKFLSIAAVPQSGRLSEEEIGEWVLNDIGILTKEFVLIKARILAWLRIAMTPNHNREKKRELETKKLEILHAGSDSHGESTENSALVSSDGLPKSFGQATSGT